VLGYLGLSVGAGLAMLGLDLLSAGLTRLKRTTWNEPGLVARNLALGLQILLILSVSSFFHKAPEFVYRAF